MRDIVGFTTNVLAAVNGPRKGESVEIGLYTVYAANASDAAGLDPWTILPYQNAAEFELDPEWADSLRAALDMPGVDDGGYAPIIRRLREYGVLDESREQIIVLLTDGFVGNYTAELAKDLRDDFEGELEALDAGNKTTFHVLRFECPGLTGEGQDSDETKRLIQIYETDVERWNSLAGQELIHQIVVPLPPGRTVAFSNNMTLYQRPHTEAAVTLIEHPSLAPLLPQSEGNMSGWGWIEERSSASLPVELPGDTGVLRLWAVASSDNDTFEAFVERGEDSDSPELEKWAFANSFNLDEHDSTLGKILAGKTKVCGPIQWHLEGMNRLAFYWWEAGPVSYSLNRSKVTVAENNGDITVALDIEPDRGVRGHQDCFSVRISLHAGKQVPVLLGSTEMTLREWEEDETFDPLPGGYADDPANDGQLAVTVELLRNLNISMNSSLEREAEIRQQIASWTSPVAVVYEPRLHDSEGVNCSKDSCVMNVSFDFATQNYHDHEAPDFRVFLLSSQTVQELQAHSEETSGTSDDATPDDAPDCSGYAPAGDDFRLENPGATGLRSGFELGTVAESNLPYWREEIRGLRRHIHTSDIPLSKIEGCGYRAVLVQWSDHPQDWPAVLCALDPDVSVPCTNDTALRVYTDDDD